MANKRSKKLNPRRIPMPKNMIDREAILEEATKDDMYRAWLLVFNALIEQGRVELENIPLLTDDVNRYIGGSTFHGDKREDEIVRAERIMGIPSPYANLSPANIKSMIDLERFKQKVFKIATHTALCVICLGFDAAGRFSKDELRQIFFNVDLTLTEIDRGCNSFDAIENELKKIGVQIERIDDDFHDISIAGSAPQ